MTSKIVLGAIIAIAIIAGTITTATLAEAKPNTDGDGDGTMEGIIHEITDLLNHATYGLEAIQNAITSVQSDITMIKSDVGDIKTETNKIQMVKDDVGLIKTETNKIQMVKDDVGDIKTDVSTIKNDIENIENQLAKIPEPLSKFTHFTLRTGANDQGTPSGARSVINVEFTSDGSMIMEVCKRSGANGDAPNDPDAGEGWVYVHHVEQEITFLMLEDTTPECRTMGTAAGEHIIVTLVADAGTFDLATIGADITIRTTPSSEIVQTFL